MQLRLHLHRINEGHAAAVIYHGILFTARAKIGAFHYTKLTTVTQTVFYITPSTTQTMVCLLK